MRGAYARSARRPESHTILHPLPLLSSLPLPHSLSLSLPLPLTQTLVQFYWTFAAAFSGQKVFPEVGTSIFNMILTAAPIVILATFDRDVPEKVCVL